MFPGRPKKTPSSRPTDRSAPPMEETDRSELDSIRREWRASELDLDNDPPRGGLDGRCTTTNDDYRSMMQAGALMCQALRHELHGHGIPVGSDLREIVHGRLFAWVTVLPDGKTLTEQASRQIRLARPRSRKIELKFPGRSYRSARFE
jgi:hypothetical protein